MEPTWFKKALSYLWDIHVESCSSEYNPEMHVLLSRGRYQLVTDKAIYSHEDLYENFSKILNKTLDLSDSTIKEVLVLGLGLGSIPIILDQIRPGGFNITAVELDEVICQLASDYAYHKITSPIDTLISDAYSYVLNSTDKFDLICVDLFVGEHTPQKFRSKRFLDSLRTLESEQGVTVYNTLAYTKSDKSSSKEFFEHTYKQVFEQAKMVYAHKNYMLISNSRWFR